MKQLTNAQNTLLQAIERLKRAMGMSPTVQEIAVKLGVKAPSVFEGLKRLEDKGYIRRQARKARSIEILRAQNPDKTDMTVNSEELIVYWDYQFNFTCRSKLIRRQVITICVYGEYQNYLEPSYKFQLQRVDCEEPLLTMEGLFPIGERLWRDFEYYEDYMNKVFITACRHIQSLIDKALEGSTGEGIYICEMYLYGAITKIEFQELLY